VLAASVAAIVRVVLEHEAIQREMARQARTDPLTGLLNRRAFLEELPRYIDRLDRDELAGTLMFADLDNFKQLNDRLGHEAGDTALCLIATLLREAVRPTDLVARLGGDEFALWLNGADHLTAAERAEYLRVETPRRLEEIAGGCGLSLGVSIGIATRRADGGEQTDSLMRRADMAMYEVKRSGRGHWRVASEDIG
jgi:diguanylate cyclase (GGDEF)-like protein